MNLPIINLLDNSKLKHLGKNLSMPAVFYYMPIRDNKSVSDLIHNFNCDKDSCCIDKNVYNNLLDNIKAKNSDIKQHNKNATRRKSKKYISIKKTKKLKKNKK